MIFFFSFLENPHYWEDLKAAHEMLLSILQRTSEESRNYYLRLSQLKQRAHKTMVRIKFVNYFKIGLTYNNKIICLQFIRYLLIIRTATTFG